MSIRTSASRVDPVRPGGVLRAVLPALCWLLLLPGILCAEELIIVSLQLNHQNEGEAFVVMRDDGDFLVRVSDLQAAGLSQFPEQTVEIDGEPHVSLAAMPGVAFHLDEATLTLELTVAPEQLPRSTFDLSPHRRESVIYPHDDSLFLNYGIEYTTGSSDAADFDGVDISNELGARFHDLLLLSGSHYVESTDDSRFVRLDTSLTWDDRTRLRRFVGGDLVARSGDLGSRVQMGGVSVSKLYRIDPYYISYPLFDFSGVASLPSEVDLYVGGVKVRSEKIAPGEFELLNYQGIGGAQTFEVVVRDALGREQRVVAPFYFSDQLLRRGLHEYSYNLGFLREEFGQESNSYSDAAFSAFHRYGVNDILNLGLRGELTGELVNLGFESAFKPGRLGLMRVQGAGSLHDGKSGGSGLFSYEFFNQRFRGRLAVQMFSEDYRTLGSLQGTALRKASLLAGIGYVTPRYGSFAGDYTQTSSYAASVDRTVLGLSWSRRVWRETYANAFVRRVSETTTSYEAGINLTWFFGRERTVSGSIRRESDENVQVLEARRNTPAGEGTGWSLRGENSSGNGTRSSQFSADLQHNARQAIVRGEASLGQSDISSSEDLRLAVSGALVYIGETFAMTRPVSDSFALVSVGDAEGVGVYVNGQPSGHTDRHGRLILPELSSYYENQLYIEDQDIPLDYLMSKVRLFVSPPLRSGSCINFPLRKYQGISGTLLVDKADAEPEPLGYAELTLDGPAGKVVFWSGRDGEFYVDNQQDGFAPLAQQGCGALQAPAAEFLPAGSYRLSVRQEERSFDTEITIPPLDGPLVDLGNILLPYRP